MLSGVRAKAVVDGVSEDSARPVSRPWIDRGGLSCRCLAASLSILMPLFDAAVGALRTAFFRNFFHLLLIASSAAIWAVPMWAAFVLTGMRVPVALHAVGVAVIYALNRSLVRGPRHHGGDWLRRYSAVAFVVLLCGVFLLVSSSFFAVVGALGELAHPAVGRAVAGASRWWGLGGIALLSTAMIFGYTGGQRQLHLNRFSVPLPGWTSEWRVIQLSDIHVGQNLSIAQLEDFVEQVNLQTPDLICITGDIADGPQADLEGFFPLLSRLRARLGVIAILGNHDHYAGADRVALALQSQGIRVLRDESLTLEIDGERLHIIGLDDRGLDWARGMHDDSILERLLREAPADVPQLLLVHRPDVFRRAAREGVSLTLSGHTHGGQLAVPWFGGRRRNLAEFITAFDRGMFHAGRSRLYVNCGLGVTAQRIRLFTPREISIFELVSGSEAVDCLGAQTQLQSREVA